MSRTLRMNWFNAINDLKNVTFLKQFVATKRSKSVRRDKRIVEFILSVSPRDITVNLSHFSFNGASKIVFITTLSRKFRKIVCYYFAQT